jgi:cell division protein FtsB
MTTPIKILTVTMAAVLVALQYRIWVSRDGVRSVWRLEHVVAAHKALNARLTLRNERLAGEVKELETGTSGIEELARSQLGMIGPNETFYQVIEPAPRVPAPKPAAARKGSVRK